MARELVTNDVAKIQQIVTGGGAILEVVGIDGQTSKDDLTTWVNSSKLTITSLRDPDDKYPQSQQVFMTREWTFIVDLRTMKIVSQFFGSHGGGDPSITAINAALDDIMARLKS